MIQNDAPVSEPGREKRLLGLCNSIMQSSYCMLQCTTLKIRAAFQNTREKFCRYMLPQEGHIGTCLEFVHGFLTHLQSSMISNARQSAGNLDHLVSESYMQRGLIP